MKPIRILQVLDTINSGSGVAAVVLNYYQYLEKDKVIFDFMVNEEVDKEVREALEENGSSIYRMPSLELKNYFQYQMELKRFFQEHSEYSIVHGHIPNAAAFYLKAAKEANVLVRIVHSHNSMGADKAWKRIRNRILSQIGILYATDYMACGEKAARYLYGKEKKEIYLMRNAIDSHKFRYQQNTRQKMRERLGWEQNYVIGNIGRFCPQKNQEFLLRVFREVYQRDKTARLLLVGDGEKRNKIEKWIKEKGYQNIIVCTGVTRDVNSYLQAMDIFVLPSRYEGVPIAALEAQAAGLFCLVSTEVTREIQTEYTQYLPLEDGAKEWAEVLLKRKKEKRIFHLPNGYEIRGEVVELIKKYQEMGAMNERSK